MSLQDAEVKSFSRRHTQPCRESQALTSIQAPAWKFSSLGPNCAWEMRCVLAHGSYAPAGRRRGPRLEQLCFATSCPAGGHIPEHRSPLGDVAREHRWMGPGSGTQRDNEKMTTAGNGSFQPLKMGKVNCGILSMGSVPWVGCYSTSSDRRHKTLYCLELLYNTLPRAGDE